MPSKELVAASTKPLVLAALAGGESYGYELIQRIQQASRERIEWSEGMLYPFLHWMEDQGLIESEWKTAENGRRRKYYHLTEDGRKAIPQERDEWLAVHETLSRLWKQMPHLI